MSAVGKLGHGKVIHGEKANWEKLLAASAPKVVSAGCPKGLGWCFPICRSLSICSFTWRSIYLISSLIPNKKEGYRRPPPEMYRIKLRGNGLLFRENHTQMRLSPRNWGRETESLRMTMTGKVLGGSRWVAAGDQLNPPPQHSLKLEFGDSQWYLLWGGVSRTLKHQAQHLYSC